MDISQQKLQELLEEIDRLRRENAMLREAAGIKVSADDQPPQIQVTTGERQALLKKSI